MSALNNLRKKWTPPTLGEDELLAQWVRSYPCLYDKTFKENKEWKKEIETQKGKNSIVADNTF